MLARIGARSDPSGVHPAFADLPLGLRPKSLGPQFDVFIATTEGIALVKNCSSITDSFCGRHPVPGDLVEVSAASYPGGDPKFDHFIIELIPSGVLAELARLGRVYAGQPYPRGAERNCIAVDYSRPPGFIGPSSSSPKQQQRGNGDSHPANVGTKRKIRPE